MTETVLVIGGTGQLGAPWYGSCAVTATGSGR
jgi:hypothetical protein